MTIDVSGLSAKELKTLIAHAEEQQTKALIRPKASAMRAKINQYVKDHVYTIEELYGVLSNPAAGTVKKPADRKPVKSAGSKVPPPLSTAIRPNLAKPGSAACANRGGWLRWSKRVKNSVSFSSSS